MHSCYSCQYITVCYIKQGVFSVVEAELKKDHRFIDSTKYGDIYKSLVDALGSACSKFREIEKKEKMGE